MFKDVILLAILHQESKPSQIQTEPYYQDTSTDQQH